MKRTPDNRGGFTLLELMIVMAIAVLLVGIGAKGMGAWDDSAKLRRPLDEMKVLAKKAWHRAIAEQRDWEIVIKPRSLELRPKQAAASEDQKFLDAADKQLGRDSGIEVKTFDADISFAVRRFGEEKWQTPRPDYWVFKHSGICEPLMFRVERENRWTEVQFDPLTAGVQREESDE
ncbi:MAG: prepilin-type N-terminal cleavage/methylation domain-containing protein [Verrucomicrobiales bacterium]|nr:prepilin-type N-terminal cleavage/methylation domain-containing protein [Verrucomicrobiales bacterium]